MPIAKYVFSYTSASERLATSFLEHRKTECANEFSYVNEVLDYLMNAEELEKFYYMLMEKETA